MTEPTTDSSVVRHLQRTVYQQGAFEIEADKQQFISALTGQPVVGVGTPLAGVGARVGLASAPVSTGEDLKRKGQQRAKDNVPSDYRLAFDAEVRHRIRLAEPFTVEAITDAVGLPPNRNAVGALMSAWLRTGRLEVLTYVRSQRPERHSGLIALYKVRGA